MPGPVGPESVIASLYWQFRTRWPETRHLIVDPISSPVSCFGWSGCKAWVLSAASPWYPASPTSSHEPVLNDAFSKPHICDFVFTVHFHVTTWEQSGRLVGGRCPEWKPPKPFGRSAFSYWSPFQTLPSADICTSTDSRTKIFSPKIAAVVLMLGRAHDVPMKRKNLSKTLKVAKKNLFQVINYLLFLLPVQFIMLLTTIAKK